MNQTTIGFFVCLNKTDGVVHLSFSCLPESACMWVYMWEDLYGHNLFCQILIADMIKYISYDASSMCTSFHQKQWKLKCWRRRQDSDATKFTRLLIKKNKTRRKRKYKISNRFKDYIKLANNNNNHQRY